MINDFINLIFPRLCCACSNALLKHEKIICVACQFKLPKTNFHLDKQNKLNKIFWGRVEVENIGAYYFFNKGNKVQNLLHQLKYKGVKEIGQKIGELYGYDLLNTPFKDDVDIIIPVPLHQKKLKIRGYNQSEWFAKGLSETLDLPMETDVLFRKVNSQTQTKKSRFNRWENVSDIFGIKNADKIKDKHVLLVDDVLTTGSTIEACIKILKEKDCKVSVLTIACA